MIPKSLHTVTALVNLAKHLKDKDSSKNHDIHYVYVAAEILGYPMETVDVHSMRQQALKKLSKV